MFGIVCRTIWAEVFGCAVWLVGPCVLVHRDVHPTFVARLSLRLCPVAVLTLQAAMYRLSLLNPRRRVNGPATLWALHVLSLVIASIYRRPEPWLGAPKRESMGDYDNVLALVLGPVDARALALHGLRPSTV